MLEALARLLIRRSAALPAARCVPASREQPSTASLPRSRVPALAEPLNGIRHRPTRRRPGHGRDGTLNARGRAQPPRRRGSCRSATGRRPLGGGAEPSSKPYPEVTATLGALSRDGGMPLQRRSATESTELRCADCTPSFAAPKWRGDGEQASGTHLRAQALRVGAGKRCGRKPLACRRPHAPPSKRRGTRRKP